jgi:hypothetical protein
MALNLKAFGEQRGQPPSAIAGEDGRAAVLA